MSEAIHHLRAEHDRLLTVIEGTEAVARRIEHGEQVAATLLRDITEVFQLYLYGIHRPKEDDILFAVLKRKGVHQGAGCVGAMSSEHADSEEAFATMLHASENYATGGVEAGNAWARAARLYCDHLRSHIRRENEVLFTIAERSLTDDEAADLVREFLAIDEKAKRAGIAERIDAVEQTARTAAAK